MSERGQIILFLFLSLVMVALGFFLDWLRNKRPALFEHREEDRNTAPSGQGTAVREEISEEDRKNAKDSPERAETAGPPPVSKTISARNADDRREDAAPGKEKAKTPGECSRCGGMARYDINGKPVLVEDEYGRLLRCPECLKLWYYDTAYAKTNEADVEWAKRIWPGLDL